MLNKRRILTSNGGRRLQPYKSGRFVISLLYFFSFLAMIIGYKYYLVEKWGYTGFHWQLDKTKLVESLNILLLFCFILPNRSSRASDTLLHIQFMLPILPMLVMYAAADQSRAYIYSSTLAFIVLIYSCRLPLSFSSRGSLSHQSAANLFLALSIVYFILIISMGGMRYLNFDLFEVYSYRRDAAANLPRIFGYVSPVVGKVLLPFSLLLAIRQKNYMIATLSFLGSVMMFALTGHKGPLFYPVIALGIYFAMQNKAVITFVVGGYFSVTLLSLVALSNTSVGDWIGTLILRRSIFMPAGTNFGYYSFFASHEFMMLSNTKLSFGLIENPYGVGVSPQFMLGELFTGAKGISANTGWLGTGYMHFGVYGLTLFAFVIGVLIRITDFLAQRQGKALAVSLAFAPFFALFTSTDLPSALLTHGLGLSLIILWLLSPQYRRNGKRHAK